ncbi:hypothetical protein HRbin22_02146 [Candidatus Thermoflexus japonica]|uniref:DUF2029 domain-containing protein n=1 Tax=Candidatus Thermoflexus japonica TaxID=2035417 RepID=A0A2H5Y8V1_9CHLR|nr:hypothetical protein HRbin22_02146 [Candidatus Thermoflexus japonica]
MKDKIWIALVAITGIVAVISLGRILTKPKSGIDFYSLIWYPGHWVWRGADPYGAALERRIPALPIYYWDGAVNTEFPMPVEPMPTNLAPLVLFLAPLARFSWPTAMNIWTIVNMGMAVLFVWSVMRFVGHRLLSREGLLILLLFFSLIATREVIETGQTTLFVLACMMLALVVGSSSQSIGGILLGMALSKYSLTFPGALYFLHKRWYRGFTVSIGVQLVGLLILAVITQTPPPIILAENLRMMLMHRQMPGLHLSATLLNGGGLATSIAGIALSAGLVILLGFWYRSAYGRGQLADIVLLVIVMQWNLLILPHRRYDHVAEIVFLALMTLWTGSDSGWRFGKRTTIGLQLFAALAASVWIFPLYYLLGEHLYMNLFASCSLTALVVSIWLLFRTRSVYSSPTENPIPGEVASLAKR